MKDLAKLREEYYNASTTDERVKIIFELLTLATCSWGIWYHNNAAPANSGWMEDVQGELIHYPTEGVAQAHAKRLCAETGTSSYTAKVYEV